MPLIAVLKTIARKEKTYFLISSLLAVFVFLSGDFVFFQRSEFLTSIGGRDHMTAKDLSFLSLSGIEGIPKQTYFFLFVFLCLLQILFFLFWSYFSLQLHKADLYRLRIRGFGIKESNIRFWWERGFLSFTSLVLSYGISEFLLWITHIILKLDHRILGLNYKSLIVLFSFTLLYFLISLPFYLIPFKEKRLLSFLRENY